MNNDELDFYDHRDTHKRARGSMFRFYNLIIIFMKIMILVDVMSIYLFIARLFDFLVENY